MSTYYSESERNGGDHISKQSDNGRKLRNRYAGEAAGTVLDVLKEEGKWYVDASLSPAYAENPHIPSHSDDFIEALRQPRKNTTRNGGLR